jgi:hypothetical protein
MGRKFYYSTLEISGSLICFLMIRPCELQRVSIECSGFSNSKGTKIVSRVRIFGTVIVVSIKIAAVSAIELSSASTVRIVRLVIMVRIVSAAISVVIVVSCHIWSPRVDNTYLFLRLPRRAYDMLFVMLFILLSFPLFYFRYSNYDHF